MKQWLSIFLIVFLLGTLAVTASASTIPVNITPGWVVQISGQSAIGNDLFTSVGANFNDQLALGLGYASPSNYYIVSVRYSFVENYAVALSYATSNPIAWNMDFRMKYDFDESLALVGVAGFDGNPYLTGQVEYWFLEQVSGNIGFNYSASVSSLILGVEFVIDRLDIGLDCRFPGNDPEQSQVALFVVYKF